MATTKKVTSKDTGTVNIHGKEYQTVALRVKKFREAHPSWNLITSIIENTDSRVVMKAEIYDACDSSELPVATGHAEEYRASSQINKTSALENCETSAIGRALGSLGLGGTEFCTADELSNAIHQQSKPQPKPDPNDPARAISGAEAARLTNLIEEKRKAAGFTSGCALDVAKAIRKDVLGDERCQTLKHLTMLCEAVESGNYDLDTGELIKT